MAVAVPFIRVATPYNSRVLPTNDVAPERILLLGDFAQALWFLIDTGGLPRLQDGDNFRRALLKMVVREVSDGIDDDLEDLKARNCVSS